MLLSEYRQKTHYPEQMGGSLWEGKICQYKNLEYE